MRYVLLIYGVEAEYANMSPEEHAALMGGHALFAEETLKGDQLKGGAPLQPTPTARTIRVRQGKLMVTDGPFAETKEQLAGLYVLDCKSLDEAIALAARIPDVRYGSVEIRQVIEIQ